MVDIRLTVPSTTAQPATIMKKFLAVLLIIFGIYSLFINLPNSGGDGSKLAAGVGVAFVPIALGAWLWQKPAKKQTEQL